MQNKFYHAIATWGGWLARCVSPEIEKRICFIHTPKCGGKSIRRAIANTYKPRPFKSGAYVILAREMAMREAEQLAGQRRGFVRMDLLNYHLALPKARCVMGHYILSRETVLRYKNEWDFVTILRDPVDRWYSHYFYNKGTNSIFSIDTELDKFVETTRALSMGSQYVSVVTGRRDIEALRSNPCIEEAIDTLSNFSLVGLLENLDDFCDTFKEKFGVRLNVPYINITPREKRRGWEHIPEKIHQKVVVLCQPDIEVYRIISGRR